MGARSYEVSRQIAAPAAVVWTLLTDAAAYPQWNGSVVSIAGTIEPGGTIRLVSTAAPERTFVLKVRELQAPQRMVWTSGMPAGLFTGRRTFTVHEHDALSCTFTMQEVFSGPLAPLITRAIPDLTESFALFADGLVAAAQAQAR